MDCFYDGADTADVFPGYGDTELAVGGTPSARPDKQVFPVGCVQFVVEFTDFSSYLNCLGWIEFFWFNISNLQKTLSC